MSRAGVRRTTIADADAHRERGLRGLAEGGARDAGMGGYSGSIAAAAGELFGTIAA